MRDRIINIFTFAVLTLLWLGFAVAFLFNPDTLDQAREPNAATGAKMSAIPIDPKRRVELKAQQPVEG